MTPLNEPLQLTDGDLPVGVPLRDEGDLERHARNVSLALAQGITVGQAAIVQILRGGIGPLPALKPHEREA